MFSFLWRVMFGIRKLSRFSPSVHSWMIFLFPSSCVSMSDVKQVQTQPTKPFSQPAIFSCLNFAISIWYFKYLFTSGLFGRLSCFRAAASSFFAVISLLAKPSNSLDKMKNFVDKKMITNKSTKKMTTFVTSCHFLHYVILLNV